MASDVKLLRDETARLVAKKRTHAVIVEQADIIKAQDAQLVELPPGTSRSKSFYENLHAQPSHSSILTRPKKAAGRKARESGKKPGRKTGHGGASHTRR